MYIASKRHKFRDEWKVVGVFTDSAMAKGWVKGKHHYRKIESVKCLDKSFAQMSVEYNKSYEG